MSESNYTPIVTPEERIRQLESQNVNNQNRNRQLQVAIDNGNREINNKMQDINRASQDREDQHNLVIGSLQSDIRESEIRNQVRIRRQREEFEKTLKTQRNEYIEIAALHQGQLDGLKESVNEIQLTEEHRNNLAVKRLADLNILIKDVDENIPHQRYAPNRIHEIINKAREAQNEINNNLPQSANVEIRAAYRELVNLREEILHKQMEFDIVYNQTLEALNTLLNQLKHKNIEIDNISRDIDYWSEGEFSKLENQITVLKEELERKKDSIKTEEVKKIFQEIGKLEQRQKTIVTKAQNAVLASFERERIAIAIAKKLKEANYPIVDGNGYEREDPRKAYIIRSKLTMHEGSSDVVAIIEPKPIGDSEFQNGLLIVSNANESEELKKLRAESIAKSLVQIGCKIGQTVCNSHDALPELNGNNTKQIIKKEGTGIPDHLRKRLLG